MADAVAAQSDPPELLRQITTQLRAVVPFDFLGVLLLDSKADVLRLTVLVSEDIDSGKRRGLAWSFAPTSPRAGRFHKPRSRCRSRISKRSPPSLIPARPAQTLADAERDGLQAVLAAAKGRVGGPTGAARLGMKRIILQSKMKKLGIANGAGE